MLTNYHTHCDYCDGKGTPEAVYQRAAELKLAALGFSSHAPMPFANDWTMAAEKLPQYLAAIRKLKQATADRDGPEVYLGLEIDYIPGVMSPADADWDSLGLDYRIGSVHALSAPDAGQPLLTVDGTETEVRQLLNQVYEGDAQAMVGDYYRRVMELCQQGGFDILGHFDLVKKKNAVLNFLDESADWYHRMVSEALDAVAAAGVIMEVNTGGIIRGATDEVYPSPWILALARQRGIPVHINFDAHHPKHLGFHFRESCQLLREAGYDRVRVLLAGRWQDIPLSDAPTG